MSGFEFLVLTPVQKLALVDEKTLSYEASIYDATLELNMASAGENESAVADQSKRLASLQAGLAVLRDEAASLDPTRNGLVSAGLED